LLQSWGCRIVQGYYYSKPLAAPEATALLRIGKVDPDHPGALALTAATRA
jgi:predicted signal transduction protein with EAL and GGDEF domain